MPNVSSSLGTTQRYIPAAAPSQIGRFAGLAMVFPTLAALNAAVADERLNITDTSAIWADGQEMAVANEAAFGVSRRWNATAQHARSVVLGAGTVVTLGADSNVVLAGAGAPGGGAGADGDVYVDTTAKAYHTKAAGAWSLTSSFGGSGTGLTSDQLATLNGVEVTGLVVNSEVTGSANTNVAAIQARLDLKGLVRVTAKGTVWVNAPLLIGDDTTLYLGPDTVIKMMAGIQNVFVETKGSAINTDRAVTGITSVGTLATVNITAHGRAVNDWVCLGGSTSGGYNGAFQVESVVDANNYRVRLLIVPAVTAAAGTLVERLATKNIGVIGPGWWDNNRANRTPLGSKRDMCFMLTYCANVTIDIRCRNAIHRVIGTGYTNGLYGPGLIYENGIGGLINGGPVSNYDIGMVQGNSSVDDLFALQGSDYAAYAIGSPGDCLRCKVGAIRGIVTSVGNAVKITGAVGFRQDLEIGLIEAECTVSDLIQVVNDAAVVGSGTFVGSLVIGSLKHINPVNNSAAVKVARDSGTPVLDNLVIQSAVVKVPAGINYSFISPNNANCTINRVKLFNIDIEGATANQLIYALNQIGAITEVQIDNFRMKNGGSLFVHDAAGTESNQKLQLANVSMSGCGSMISFRRSLSVHATNCRMDSIGTATVSSGSVATLTLVGDITVDVAAKQTNLASNARVTPFSRSFQANGDFVTAALNASFWNTNTTWASGSGTDKAGFYAYNGATWAKLYGPA